MSVPETPPPAVEADHREFLYMGIGWLLMDLRQDIEFDQFVLDEHKMTKADICSRLADLQRMCAEYADEHFPHANRPERSDGF